MKISPIKNARDNARISQKELAARTGISQAQISRYEQPNFDTGNIGSSDLHKISVALGVDYKELIEESLSKPEFNVSWEDPYSEHRNKLQGMIKHLTNKSEWKEKRLNEGVEEFSRLARIQKKCPIALLRGDFDSGKSYAINKMVNEDILPTKYQPETGAVMYLIHEEFRPEGADGKVLLFQQDFDLRRFMSGELQAEKKISSGGVELLRKASIKSGKHREVEVAIIFSEAPILKSVILCDTPGTEGETSNVEDDNLQDLKKIYRASSRYDILIYLSSTQSFFNDKDIEHFKHLLGQLNLNKGLNSKSSPLDNILILMTHASPSVSDEDVREIKKTAPKRILKRLGELSEIERIEEIANVKIKPHHIAKRIFPFWFEMDSRRNEVGKELYRLLNQQFPPILISEVNSVLDEYRESASRDIKKLLKQYESLLDEKGKIQNYLEELRMNEPIRQSEVKHARELLETRIDLFRLNCEKVWPEIYSQSIEPNNIQKIIQTKFKKKREARKATAGYLHDKMQDDLKKILIEQSEEFSEQVNDYIHNYETAINLKRVEFSDDDIKIDFDPIAAFAGGLTGAATYGAFAIWASSLGNLGGYIISSKILSILSAIGLGTSASAFAALVASIGGPITIFIGLAIITASVAFRLFGKSWQQRLSEKIHDKFESEGYKGKINDSLIVPYWNDTKLQFRNAADTLEQEYQRTVSDLEDKVENYDPSEIEAVIQEAKQFINFIEGVHLTERT
jgi:transcriptional regulator with XRE-family HTH domain